eukprot:scaffold114513_cov18-Tisochrysis_lutea.AAC.7
MGMQLVWSQLRWAQRLRCLMRWARFVQPHTRWAQLDEMGTAVDAPDEVAMALWPQSLCMACVWLEDTEACAWPQRCLVLWPLCRQAWGWAARRRLLDA